MVSERSSDSFEKKEEECNPEKVILFTTLRRLFSECYDKGRLVDHSFEKKEEECNPKKVILFTTLRRLFSECYDKGRLVDLRALARS
jgi:hypothetical protein